MAIRTTTRRRGVSLIEMLVVIALIGLLSAISAGAVFRLRSVQDQNNAEGTLSKVHSNLQTRWSAVLDQAKKDVPQALIDGLAEGDKDRAIAIWSYAKLQNEFPENFVEAKRTITLNGVALKPRKAFETIANDPANSSLSTDQQSAVLICAAILSTGNSGNAMASDGIQNQTMPILGGNSGSNCFKDSWGSPIVFRRHGKSSEINDNPSFTRGNSVKTPGTGVQVTMLNSLDPLGKLTDWTGNTAWANAARTSPSVPASWETVAFQLGFASSIPHKFKFKNENSLPTLISAGKNKQLGTNMFGGDDGSDDNILSFRLRREGDRGN